MERWDEVKNQELKERHGAGFDDLLADGSFTGLIEVNAKYPDQVRLVYVYRGYAWVLVFEPQRNRFSTAWPSRKHMKEVRDEDK